MKHILITNQHGENRGDESALRALLDGVDKKLSDTKYTVIAQLQDTRIKIDFEQDVSLLHMKMSITSFLGLVLYSLLNRVGVSPSFLLNENSRNIITAYNDCDVVVSAPGGPYFGDIYANHEIVHWYYVWLARAFKKPLFLYAPSAGPFNIKWLNVIRRILFKKFDVLSLREEISKGYLEQLIGNKKDIVVTADSAIQQVVEPMYRDEYFVGEKDANKNKYLVAVSAIEYKFPGENDPEAKQKEYTDTLLQCLKHLAAKKDCHFLFIPQLYGMIHTDVSYLEYLSAHLPDNATWEIVDQSYNSNVQRALFGMSDICIASRYHPQIFAGSSGVPGVCIYYEHKALGFMQLLGLEDFAFDIRKLKLHDVISKLDEAVDNRVKISNIMKNNIGAIRKRSERTTDLLVKLIKKK